MQDLVFVGPNFYHVCIIEYDCEPNPEARAYGKKNPAIMKLLAEQQDPSYSQKHPGEPDETEQGRILEAFCQATAETISVEEDMQLYPSKRTTMLYLSFWV